MADTSKQNKSNVNNWLAIAVGFLMFLLGIFWAVHYQEYGWISTSKYYVIPTQGRLAEFIICLTLVSGLLFFFFGFIRIFRSILSKKI